MVARKKATAKRSTAKRSTATRSTGKSRFTTAQIENAVEALAQGNVSNAQAALGLAGGDAEE